jgi:uncharacterized membrane protein
MQKLKHFFLQPWLYLFILVIGVFLKFYTLDHKLFWYDEIATVMQVAAADNIFEIDPGEVNKIENISYYTELLNHRQWDYPLGEQLKAQLQNMNLNPLHYTLLSFWYRIVGDDIVHYRLFSVFIFLLTLPFLFVLAKNMFDSKQAGWIAISLYSISPYIHVFAQEARYYILWAFLLVVIHCFLILAIKKNKTKWWIWYVLSSALAMYCSILSGLILFEHLIFILIWKKNLRLKYLLAAVAIFILYLPWLHFLFVNKNEVFQALAWHRWRNPLPFWGPLVGILLGYVRTFSFYKSYTLFWDDVFNNITPDMILETFINLLVLAFFIVATIFLIKKSKKENAIFIILLILPSFLFVYILDIARNAVTSIWWRYSIYMTIPIILLVTNIFTSKAEQKKVLFSGIYLGIAALGIFSILTISQYKYWYLGGDWEQEFVDNAELFSEAQNPLVITEFIRANNPWEGPVHTMEVLANCDNDNIDVLRVSPDVKEIYNIIPQEKYSDVFVMYVSDDLAQRMMEQLGGKMIPITVASGPPMWKIEIE